MNLGAFHTLVADTAKRGATLDSFIPTATRHAVLWLERNYTSAYMKRYATFALDPDSPEPRAISFPSSRVKQIQMLGLLSECEDMAPLLRVEPQEMRVRGEGTPSAFWLDGLDFIWFDKRPTEAADGEIVYSERSNWAALGNDDTHWLLEHAEDLLLYQTMLQISPYNRDPALMTLYKPLRDEALRTLILDQEEGMQGPARKLVLGSARGR